MKTKIILSAIMGFFFGLTGYYIFLFIDMNPPFQLSVVCGLSFALLLFLFLIAYEEFMNKRYARFEKEITSPIFYKTNGNFILHNGKIKNANIYFCDDRIVLISVEEKPFVMEEILKSNIYMIQSDEIYFNINTSDGKFYIIKTPDAKLVFKMLKEKDWIIQI